MLQGNLDPMTLIDAGKKMQDSIAEILDVCSGRPHIFNLGHGITPATSVEHVDRLLETIGAAGS